MKMLRSGVAHRQTVPLLPSTLSTKPRSTERAFSRTQGPSARCQTTREVGVCHASFFETLFNGSKSGSGSGPSQADDLVSELLDIIAKNQRNKRPYIGPDERIEEIANELKSLNVTRNPARSPIIFGEYEVGYARTSDLTSACFNLRAIYQENGDVIQTFDKTNYGIFPATSTLYSTFKPTGSNSYNLNDIRVVREKGLLGTEVIEDGKPRYRAAEILHLDDRVFVLILQQSSEAPDRRLVVLIKKGTAPAPRVEKKVQSDISSGGSIAGRARKVTGATQAEKKYQMQMAAKQQKAEARIAEREAKAEARIAEREAKAEASRLQKEKQANEEANRLQKEKAAAEKEAREEAARLQKEKVAAEREAELRLKAEIKESVDGFGQRLKEAQASKKEAVAALKNFERENSEVLKEAEIVRNRLERFEAEVKGLSNEIAAMAEEEKQSAAELRDCRRELADLERQLSTL